MAAEAADAYELLAAGGGLRLARRFEPGVTVIGDGDALRRAVDNLLSNAVRLAPAGSTVTVATGARQGWAWIAVRDEGPGIDPEHEARIFDRFWRGDDARRGGRSTGLGLAIVRQILESHGGTVTVHSRPGSGATFVLWLPLAPEHRATRSPRPPEQDPLADIVPVQAG